MAFQREVGSGTNRATEYRDLLIKLVAFLTSQNVATVAVNAGGTGWTTGDEATLTHAGAILDAKFEVTAAAGAITALRITSNGAFANRIATVAVNAAGTGYAVNDVLEVQGGSSREKGKARVTTVSGGTVTGVALFETGGAYSSAPGLTGATTLGIGPSTFAGDDAATLDLTMTTLVGTTGLAVTGPGSSATVDITLAQTGWAVDRSTNDRLENSVDFEKEVVLKGDAAGKTNKPYSGYVTYTATSGLDTRYGIACLGMTAHNPATALAVQVGLSPGLSAGDALQDNGVFLLCDENQAQEMDFWFTASDSRVGGEVNTNSGAANTDDGEYMGFYSGYGNSFATETEDPYPFFIGASSRQFNIDPSVLSQSITGLAECIGPSASQTPMYFYRSETSTWLNVENSENLTTDQQKTTVMAPIAQLIRISGTADSNNIIGKGPLLLYEKIGSTGRASPTRRLVPIPGTTDLLYPIPLTVLSRPGGTTLDETLDTIRLQLDGFFWVSATNDSVATIANFSEDFITIGSDRYRVFHQHMTHQPYSYICIKEDV